MKYLQDYKTEKQTELFNRCGVFFAFSGEQFKEGTRKIIDKPELSGYIEGDKWRRIGGGGFVLSKHYDTFAAEIERIHKEAIAQDIKENGLEAIVLRELSNHEFCYTNDITDTWEAVKDYPGLTKEDVLRLSRNQNYKIPA